MKNNNLKKTRNKAENLSGIKTVIFDLDYTLFKHDVEYEIRFDIVYLGIKDEAEFRRQMVPFWQKVSAAYKNKIITEEFFSNIIEKSLPILKTEKIPAKKMLESIMERRVVELYEGTKEILSYCKGKGYKIVALTDWFKDNQFENLVFWNIDKYFDEVYGWDNSYAKPSLVNMNKIIKNEDPNSFVIIGDNLKTDIICGSKAGINTILFNNRNLEIKDVIPTFEIKHLKELKRIL